jgi:heptosyltransferase III
MLSTNDNPEKVNFAIPSPRLHRSDNSPMPSPPAKPQPRVLVIRGGAIGDFILTLPALRLLRETIVDCHLEVLGYPGISGLAVLAGLADSTRNLEGRNMAMLFAPGAKIDDELVDYLLSFNLIVSYLFDPDGFLKGNMERLGVKTFLALSHRVIEGEGHATAQLAKPLDSLAMYLDEPAPRILANTASNSKPKRIVIHPGSGSLLKTWPVEHWERVGFELKKAWPEAQLTLVTGEAEEERGITAHLNSAWANLPHEHWHSLPLTELAKRLSTSHAFLGHDSGTSHLAAACGVPCHVFFGPTNPATWQPLGSRVVVCRSEDKSLESLNWEMGWDSLSTFLQSFDWAS